jgi:AcrR family transcriptional regulator
MPPEKRSSAGRKAPQQERSRSTVARIVAATASLLRTVDPDLVTTNAISEKADLSKGSIYQYFTNKEEIILAAIELIAAEEAPAIESMLRTITLDPPEAAMASSIDMLIEFTITNRRLIRYVAERPTHARTFENVSGLTATLLAMSTLHMSTYRDQYRHELSPRSLAWLFFNMAVATTTRYIETDDPIPLDELRSGLKFASAGLLEGGRA